MPNQSRSRFWSVLCIVILKRCASLTLSNSKNLIQNQKNQPYSTSQRGFYILHSTAPLQYQDNSEELVSGQSQFTIINSCEPKVAVASTLKSNSQSTILSIPFIYDICVNQALLLLFASSTAILASFFGDNPLEISSFHWNGVQEFQSLFDWQPSIFRLIQGCLASMPMIAVGHAIKNSDDRATSRLNFATTNMVLCLFGRRKSALNPNASAYIPVFFLSTFIAISSGISEEIIFRGYIPTALSTMTHSLHLALVGQAVLFASGHFSKDAQPGENKLNWSLQFFNGIWYGLLYLITGGDILPCVIAHILYDLRTLCDTWTRINDQLDYTHECSMKCIGEEEKKVAKQFQSKTGITFDTETINFARHFFYAFDSDHAGSLSLPDCQRAVSYAFMNDAIEPDTNAVKYLFENANKQMYNEENSREFHDRLDFADFVHLLFMLRSRSRDY